MKAFHVEKQKYDSKFVNLPQGVKLLSIGDGELADPVPVDAIMHDLSFM